MEKHEKSSCLDTMKSIRPDLNIKITNPLLYNRAKLHEEDKENEYGQLFYQMYLSYLENTKVGDIDLEKFREFPTDNTPDFNEWVTKRILLFKQYIAFLGHKGLTPSRYDKDHPIELFKGNFDSLKTIYKKSLTVYSQYATTLNCDRENGAIQADISVMNGVPCYVLKTPNDQVFKVPLNMEDISKVYVHNPYTNQEARDCEKLLSNPYLTVIYGIFGLADEEGIDKKIANLRKLSDTIKGMYPSTRFSSYEDETNRIGKFKIGLLLKPTTIQKK